jgi:hypothetical protein
LVLWGVWVQFQPASQPPQHPAVSLGIDTTRRRPFPIPHSHFHDSTCCCCSHKQQLNENIIKPSPLALAWQNVVEWGRKKPPFCLLHSLKLLLSNINV